ncbi:MAG: SCE4755 family polysaccharide monooxygenase-like protein [Deltaproteobacteria bacterium]|nr:SCE4755 family polysaccharide monooxygenase-like protein [Deltaproteobacteria bacterium]
MKFHALVPASMVGVGSLFAAQTVQAHIKLTAPTPRVANTDSIKTSPCGPAARSAARVSTFKPGEMVTVEWDETVPHPGYFRILFDDDGQNFAKPTPASFKLFHDYYNGQRNNTTVDKLPKAMTGTVKEGDTWTLADYWNQHPSGAMKSYSIKVTLPNVTCNNCTLQVVQSMFENGRTYDSAYYYHCADLILKGDGASNPDAGGMQTPDAGAPSGQGGAGGGGGSGGKAPSGGTGGGAAGSAGSAGGSNSNEGGTGGDGEGGAAGSGNDDSDKKSGGCAFGGPGTGAGFGLLSALGLLLFRRRRT